MKKIIYTLAFVTTIFGFSSVSFASPSSVDREPGFIQPLINTDYLRVDHIVATSTTATSTFPIVRNGEIADQHPDGSWTYTVATTSTDIGRGNALLYAVNIAQPGDVLYLASTTYDTAQGQIDLTMGGQELGTSKGALSIRGAGEYNTVIENSRDDLNNVCGMVPAQNSVISDLTLLYNGPASRIGQGICVAFNTGNYSNVTIRNVFIKGGNIGIIAEDSSFFGIDPPGTIFDGWTIDNVTIKTGQFGINFLPAATSTWNIYNSSISLDGSVMYTPEFNNVIAGIWANNSSSTINVFNTSISAATSTTATTSAIDVDDVDNNKGTKPYGGTVVNSFGGIYTASSTKAYVLLNNRNLGTINVTANTVYNAASTSGKIIYIDNPQIRYSIGSNGASSTVLVNQNGIANWQSTSSLGFSSGGSGTVTSVAATVPAFLSISGSPVTTSGTLAIALSGAPLQIGNGGTGMTTFPQGWIYSLGGTSAFNSSTSPTVNYLTATSTAATSTFPILSVASSSPEGNFKFTIGSDFNVASGTGMYTDGNSTIRHYPASSDFYGAGAGPTGAAGAIPLSNVAIGDNNFQNATLGANNNFCFGSFACNALTSGSTNTAIGVSALRKDTTGQENVALGADALGSENGGGGDIAIGFTALPFNNGGGNGPLNQDICVGTFSCLFLKAGGDNNIVFGAFAGELLTTATNNVLIGLGAGSTDGNNNTVTCVTCTNMVAMGYEAQVSRSNTMVLGGVGTNALDIVTGSTSPWAKLSVMNTFQATEPLFDVATTTSAAFATSSLFNVQANGNVGVGTSSPWKTFSVTGSEVLTGGLFDSLSSSGSNGNVLTSTGSATKWQSPASALAATSTGSLRNQTGTVTSVNTYTPTASSTYEVTVSASIQTISAGTLTLTCTYTNTDNVSSTATFFPMGLTTAGLSGTGSPALSPLSITPMKNTVVTVVATFTGVSINYDIDANIIPLGTGTK